MKKIISVTLGIAGFVIAWMGVSVGESDMTVPLINIVVQIYAGLMLMGAGVALARWK